MMVDICLSLTREKFHLDYRSRHAPVVVRGLARDWLASERWTPEYLRRVCGDEPVEILANRNQNPSYETSYHMHRAQMSFAGYVDWVVTAGSSNDRYIHAQNRFFDTPVGQRLRADVAPVPDWVDPSAPGRMFFWLGPAGTVTPLHHDDDDILFAQIRGRKRFTLFSPGDTPFLYNHVAVFSEVDPESPDYGRHPLYRRATPIVVDLEPGDALFLPRPWWHHVRALDVSVSVSFTGFR